MVDEIRCFPVTPGGANLHFQLVNVCYEMGAMILTSNVSVIPDPRGVDGHEL